MTLRRLAPLFALVLLAACHDAEHPALAVGTWAHHSPLGEYGIEGFDTLRLSAHGAAVEHEVVFVNAKRQDDLTKKSGWRIVTEPTTHEAKICTESEGIGNAGCSPIFLAGDTLTMVTRPKGERAIYTRVR